MSLRHAATSGVVAAALGLSAFTSLHMFASDVLAAPRPHAQPANRPTLSARMSDNPAVRSAPVPQPLPATANGESGAASAMPPAASPAPAAPQPAPQPVQSEPASRPLPKPHIASPHVVAPRRAAHSLSHPAAAPHPGSAPHPKRATPAQVPHRKQPQHPANRHAAKPNRDSDLLPGEQHQDHHQHRGGETNRPDLSEPDEDTPNDFPDSQRSDHSGDEPEDVPPNTSDEDSPRHHSEMDRAPQSSDDDAPGDDQTEDQSSSPGNGPADADSDF